jgi:hypothetical protein
VNDRRALILLVVAIAAVVIAKVVFNVRVAVAGFKYVLVLGAIVVAVALLASRGRDRKP